MPTFAVICVIGLAIFMLYLASVPKQSDDKSKPKPEPEPKPEPKPDPDKKTQEKLALEMILKNTSPDDIAEAEGYDIEHIKQWKEDYINYAVKYTLNAHKTNARIDLMEDDIQWFKETCYKYIGDDWEEKTDFKNRTQNKYK